MEENRIEGTFQNVVGKAQDAAGGLTGDAKLQGEGKFHQVVGKAQNAFGGAVDQAKDTAETVGKAVEQQPLAALLTVGVIGFALGWMMGRRG